MKKVEYSQIVRRKLKTLRVRLTNEFGLEVSKKSLRQITNAARSLEKFAERGVAVSEMFDDREDFMYKLFGISTTAPESIDYWDE